VLNAAFVYYIISEGDVTPEDTEEREKGSVEDDTNLAESSEDLKRKIEELQNASERFNNIFFQMKF